jgi:hypothetical protein
MARLEKPLHSFLWAPEFHRLTDDRRLRIMIP